MFLSKPIDDNYANMIISVLLYLESEDAKAPTAMYFNVRGGEMKSGLSMYDTMRVMPYDIQTVNMGVAAQVGSYLVASGTPGKRFALPNAQFIMQNPGMYPRLDEEGKPMQRPMQATEMELEVTEVLRDKVRMLEGFSRFTGKSIASLQQDFERDFYLDAEGAMHYGIVDQLLSPKSMP